MKNIAYLFLFFPFLSLAQEGTVVMTIKDTKNVVLYDDYKFDIKNVESEEDLTFDIFLDFKCEKLKKVKIQRSFKEQFCEV